MVKEEKNKSKGKAVGMMMSCCSVESVVSIDERGQMVLPKDLREKSGIKAGDKFAVVTSEKKGDVCCITLIKTDALTDLVRDFLGPATGEIVSD